MRSLVRIVTVFLSLLSTSFFHLSMYTYAQSLHIPMRDHAYTSEELFSSLHALMPQPIVLKAVHFTADVPVSVAEFEYLTDLRAGRIVSANDMQRALYYLQKKNIFKSIDITIEHQDDGSVLSITACGLWTFARLKIRGMFTVKGHYKRYYLLEPGEAFNEEKHARSLEHILEALHKDGYYAATVDARCIRNDRTKTITVECTIARGPRFTLEDIKISMKGRKEISGIVIDGLRSDIEKKFLKILRKRAYARDTLTRCAGDIRAFLIKRGFYDVQIKVQEKINKAHSTIAVMFDVELNQRREFIVIGNQFFTRSALLDALTIFGRSVLFLPKSALQQELSDLYTDQGFFQTKIQVKDEEQKTIIVIQEGKRAHIQKITIAGCTQFDAQELIDRFGQRCLHVDGITTPEIESFLENLIIFYKDQGYLDVSITSQHSDVNDRDEQAYTLIIELYEGVCYLIDHVEIQDCPELEHQGPFLTCNETHNVAFTAEEMRCQQEWLTKTIDEAQEVRYTWKVMTERHEHCMSVRWYKKVEQELFFGKTICTGLLGVPFECVMRELVYKEGESWDYEKLKESIKQLRKLDVFDMVHLYPDGHNAQDAHRTMIAKIHGDDSFEVRTRAGLGFQQVSHEFYFLGFTYRAGGTFIAKNLFNQCDKVTCEIDVAKYDRSMMVTYSKPWLFGLPVDSLFQLYYSRQSHPGILKSSENLYQLTQQGGMVTISYGHTYGTLGVNIGVEYMATSTASAAGQDQEVAKSLARAINFSPDLLSKKVPYGVFEPTLLINRLDNTLQPTRGTFTLCSLKGMLPLSSLASRSSFFRATLEQSWFIPLHTFVFALRLRLGHIFYDSFKTIMPSERFYLGGAHSIRSYDMDFAPPVGFFKDAHGVERCVPRGGKTMVNMNIEWRLPLYNKIGLVLFQDCGLLNADDMRMKFNRLLSATGFGLRYGTVFGPLRFDIGWKPHKDVACAPRYAWFLTLGEAF